MEILFGRHECARRARAIIPLSQDFLTAKERRFDMTLKEQVRFLNKLGVSYASIEKYSGVKQTTLWAWLGKEDAKLQRANEEKLRTYLKKFRNTINKRLKETVD